jgi:hypothetical protein
MPEAATAITYADVLKGHKGNRDTAEVAWRKIGEVTGAGNVYPGEYATIGLEGVDAKVHAEVGKLKVAPAKSVPEEEVEGDEEAGEGEGESSSEGESAEGGNI